MAGLGEGGVVTVVGLLELGWWDVAAGLEQAPVVEPVEVFQGGDLDLLDGAPRPAGLISSVLNNPITDSARALSKASATEPTEGSMPAWARRSVNAIEVYWADSTGRRNTSIAEVRMGRQAGWMTAVTGRPALRSPGRPPIRRDVERAFWIKIAEGLTSEDSAIACGVSGPVGSRWFGERGGMPLIQLGRLSGRYLSFVKREEIALLRAQDVGVRDMARRLQRSPSTISRELRRNAATRSGRLDYRAGIAQWKAELMARRPKTAKLVENDRLRDYGRRCGGGTTGW